MQKKKNNFVITYQKLDESQLKMSYCVIYTEIVQPCDVVFITLHVFAEKSFVFFTRVWNMKASTRDYRDGHEHSLVNQ